MDATALLYPVFALIALTVVLHSMMAFARVRALKSGEVKVDDIVLGQPNWTARATQIANSYHSQHELPVLFYVLVAFILITSKADYVFVLLAWAFVALRLVHAFIHTTSNNINQRFPAYAAGLFILVVMWVLFGVRIVTGT